MRPARYAVLRVVADPVRNEPVNVGVLVWDEDEVTLRTDHQGILRVIRDNPLIAEDALDLITRDLEQRIFSGWPRDSEAHSAFLQEVSRGIIAFTEPRSTSIEEIPEGWDRTVARLIERFVKVKARRRFRQPQPRLKSVIKERLQPYIEERKVEEDKIFLHTSTSVQRFVDFYANSGANTALDILPLGSHRPDDLRRAADAEAYKIRDIQEANDLTLFIVACNFGADPSLVETYDEVRRILASANAVIEDDAETAVRRIEERLSLTG